jgi:hypothetical protein
MLLTVLLRPMCVHPCCMQAVEARRSERLWRERMDAFNTALEGQRTDTVDITADMSRQYKAMQACECRCLCRAPCSPPITTSSSSSDSLSPIPGWACVIPSLHLLGPPRPPRGPLAQRSGYRPHPQLMMRGFFTQLMPLPARGPCSLAATGQHTHDTAVVDHILCSCGSHVLILFLRSAQQFPKGVSNMI